MSSIRSHRMVGKVLSLLLAFLAGPSIAGSIDAALVTALEGHVSRAAEKGPLPVKNFVKLMVGDVLLLDKDARLQIVYFHSGRQETWTGSGQLEIEQGAGVSTGLSPPKIRQLPETLVKQISRTPALDAFGRAGVFRLRKLPTKEVIDLVEDTYAQLRAKAPEHDLTPEFYRLSSYFEMREIEKIESILSELKQKYPIDEQVKLLISLYREAIFRTQKPGR